MTPTRHAERARLLLLVGAFAVVLPTCRRSPTAPLLPPLEIATESLPNATRGEPYAEALHASGGDGAYAWAIVGGELPEGLELMVDDLSVDHALITGTPEKAEPAAFTVRLRSGDGQTVTREFGITVLPEPEPLAVHTRRLPPALAGAPYDFRLRANGGDGESWTWELIGGELPPGLVLTETGRIHGVPEAPGAAVFTVEVRSGGHAVEWVFTLPVVAADPQAFTITVFEVMDLPEAVRPHVDAAIAQVESAVVGNLPAVTIPPGFFEPGHCGGFGSQINGTSTDDILIVLNVMPIDGPGGVLGRAGPCGLREGSFLPFAAIVTLDVDDLTPLVGTETLTDILAHELAHALGFGALWTLAGLIQGSGTADPRFTGQRAMAEYQSLGGTGAVPLEALGGAGTAEGHWRKSVFREELMTGFIEPVGVDQPLSRVTIASWEDLGYSVDMAAADAFVLAAAAHQHAGEPGDRDPSGYDLLYDGPVLVLGRDGRATTVRLR